MFKLWDRFLVTSFKSSANLRVLRLLDETVKISLSGENPKFPANFWNLTYFDNSMSLSLAIVKRKRKVIRGRILCTFKFTK